MHPCSQSAKQLESASFQRSISPSILMPAERQNLFLISEPSSCEESHIRSLESNDFKPNLPYERRKNRYSFCNKQRVMPDNASNNKFKNRVMHPCRQNAKQLESASFQRSVSPSILTPAERQSSTLILEKQLESVSFQTSGSILSLPPLGKINQVELKCSQVKPLSNDNEKILHNICKFLKTRNIDHVIFKKLAQGKDSCFFL